MQQKALIYCVSYQHQGREVHNITPAYQIICTKHKGWMFDHYLKNISAHIADVWIYNQSCHQLSLKSSLLLNTILFSCRYVESHSGVRYKIGFFVILQLLCLNRYIFILSGVGISHEILGFALLYFIHSWLIRLLLIFTCIASLAPWRIWVKWNSTPDSKVRGANMGPTWVLSAPDGPHVGPMNLAIRDLTDTPSIRGSKNKNIYMVILWLLFYHFSWWMKHLA